jgi:drug/metabolite transporter (DMT)-like permease
MGVGMRLLAIALLGSMGALAKVSQMRGSNLAEIVFFRQAFSLPLIVALIAAGPGLASVRTTRLGAHATRTAYGILGIMFSFGALLLLPLAEATTLQFTAPIFATILGAVMLREPTGWHRWAAVLAGFAGVLIVAQPGSGHISLLGAAVGLAGAFMVGVISIQLRQMGRTESVGSTVFWFATLSLPPLGLFYLFNLQGHDWIGWALLAGIGLLGGGGQLALTSSLRYAPVSTVVPMDYSSLIWATLYGWLFFDVLPTEATWIGAPVIVASGLYIVFREHRRRQDKVLIPDL